MAEIDNSGPAFPIETTATPWAPGLTKREAFAMAAMQGIMTQPYSATIFYDDVAQIAVKAADALIKALGGEDG